MTGARCGVVVRAIRRFDSRCCLWKFSVTKYFRSHYGPGVDSFSTRNECQVYFMGVNAAGA